MSEYEYTIGWIAPLPFELIAAKSTLDKDHGEIHRDGYTFFGCTIGPHNVIMGLQPVIGTDAASDLAARMKAAFPQIEFFLVVGIGGGVPQYGPRGKIVQMVLGDVVVSCPQGKYGGVVRIDSGMWKGVGKLAIEGHTNGPPHRLLAAVKDLRVNHGTIRGSDIPNILGQMRLNIPEAQRHEFRDPGPFRDRLFENAYLHPEDLLNSDCQNCDPEHSKIRNNREEGAVRETDSPVIHYGNIASSNQLQVSADYRDELKNEHDVICFEMEGAGVIQRHPCLIIRGICDYSDSHKNKAWQFYAAATAAAYAKELLQTLPSNQKRYREAAQIFNNYGSGHQFNGTNQNNNTGSGHQFLGNFSGDVRFG